MQTPQFILFSLVITSTAQLHSQTPYLPANYSSGVKVSYVRTWESLRPESNTNNITAAAAMNDFRMTTQYLDGLGRPLQTVTKQGSLATGGTAADLVIAKVYDELGRESYKFLPSPANSTGSNTSVNDGLFKLNPFAQQAAFYGNSFSNSPIAGQGEGYYYGKVEFEASPMNRVIETFAPGDSWAGTADAVEVSHRSVRTLYAVNTMIDSVRIWTVNGGAVGTWASFSSSAAYGAGQLYKTITIDEQGKQVIEFKDKHGQLILKKVQIGTATDDGSGRGHTDWLCTYYMYDDLGRLRCVLQPQGVKNISTDWVLVNTLIEHGFRYEYDEKSREIMKRVPGNGVAMETLKVYDARDRLVMLQDGNMRLNNQWLVTKYDSLNRPIETGLWVSSSSFATHRVAAFTSTKYPSTPSNYTQLTITHYDDYSGLPGSLTNTLDTVGASQLYTSYNTSPLYAQQLAVSGQTRGMITWTLTRVVDSPNDSICLVNLYDVKGRLIQTKIKNITGGVDIFTTQYNWSGHPINTVSKTEKAGTNAQTITTVNRMSYDDLARIIKVEKKIAHSALNSGALSTNWITILEQEYDAIGQVAKKTIGNKKASNGVYYSPRQPLQELMYDYNIRGWLLGTNRDYLSTEGQTTDGKVFGFELGYDKLTSKSSNNFTAAQYNGNINGMTWKSDGDDRRRRYDFSYDGANRLLKAAFKQDSSGSTWNKTMADFTVHMGNSGADDGTAYDANGNILKMKQWGLKLTGPTQIDNLTYTYWSNGNMLKAVTDTNTIDHQLGDFTNKNTSATDYGYDKNGNLVIDLNKRINGTVAAATGMSSGGGIAYNHLNLPKQITVRNDAGTADKGMITYMYDATGEKLKKVSREDSVNVTYGGTPVKTNITTTTMYLNGVVFESKQYSNTTLNNGLGYIDKLQHFNHEEGRVRAVYDPVNHDSLTALEYDYMIKDHLRNVRMVLTEEQKTDLYPIASMEDSKLTTEEEYYQIETSKIVLASSLGQPPPAYLNDNGVGNNPPDPTFESSNSQKLYKLKGDENKMGLGITLKVMAGDKLNIMGKSYWYQNTVGAGPNVAPTVLSLLEGLLGSPSGGALGAHTTATELNGIGGVTSGVSAFLSRSDRNYAAYPDRPKAFINYIFFDEQFHYVAGDISAVGNEPGLQTHNMMGVDVPRNGYVYIYCSNESAVPVYFDNLQVGHNRGALVEETHYYPFGLTMAGISTRALDFGEPKNKERTFQSQKFDEELGLDWVQFKWRNQDPQIGRFVQIDPLSSKFPHNGTYVFSENRVINGRELEGLEVVTLSGSQDWFFLFFGGNYQEGAAFGPDGVAGFISTGGKLGLGAEFSIGASTTIYPTMNSVQDIRGDGTFAAITGGFLGKFTLGWSYSSGYHGLTVGYGWGASVAGYGGKSQTVTTPTLSWNDIARNILSQDLLKSMLPQFGISADISQAELATTIFNKFRSSALSQLDQAIESGKAELSDLNKQIDAGRNGLSQLEAIENPNKILRQLIRKVRNKVESLEKKKEKVNESVREAEEARATVNNIQQN